MKNFQNFTNFGVSTVLNTNDLDMGNHKVISRFGLMHMVRKFNNFFFCNDNKLFLGCN